MADAEVKLNFTAEIKEAENQLKTLRELIDWVAEDLSIIVSKSKEFGPFSPETVDSVRVMSEELERMRGQYDMLQQQFKALQESSSTMSVHFIEELAEWKKALQEQIEFTREQSKQIKELNQHIDEQNDKIEKQGDRIKELEKKTKDSHRTGINGYRSLRSVVGDFIVQLFKGKVAVGELGVALKGLAYSTVVLGAIQLAMDGIGWAWKGIKSLFGQSKEEMQAAEEAAKRAQEELDKAKGEAEKAAEEVQQLKKKLAEKEEAEALKETLAGITAEYVAQRDAANSTLAALKEQAQVKARERALEAAQRTGELDMELLNLEERFASGDVGKRDYIVQKADIEKRKRDEARVAAVDSAEIAKDAAEAERDRLRAELAESRKREASLLGELGKYSSPDESEIAAGEYNKTRMRRKDFEAQMDKARGDFYQKYGSLGEIDENGKFVYKRSFDEFLQENAGLMFSQDEFDEQLKHVNYLTGKVSELREREKTQKNAADAAAKGAKQYQVVARRLDEERKTAAGLEKTAKTAEDGARRANDALGATLRRTAMEGGQDDRLTDKRVQMQLAAVDRDEAAKRKAEQERAEKARLKNRVSELLQDARTAAGTKGDAEDDAAAFRAISNFLKKQGDEVEQYGVNVKALIAVCEKLNMGADKSQGRIKALERDLKSLQRKVDRTNSGQ